VTEAELARHLTDLIRTAETLVGELEQALGSMRVMVISLRRTRDAVIEADDDPPDETAG
jgi:hypothetical protein